MRPVFRGEAPGQYTRYQDAIGDLEECLGIYCSYCERRLPTSLAVEHVVPKSREPDRETDWENFLLGCTNCNSVKGKKLTNETDFLWPDKDNTFLAFEYQKGGFVKIARGISRTNRRKATEIVDLLGLDRHAADGWPAPRARDKRWQQREAIWEIAERCKARLERLGRAEDAFDLVLEAALGYGFFSVWMTVFRGDAEMSRRLVEAFKGTAADCFNGDGEALARPGGRT